MQKRLHALQSLKYLLFICLQKELSNLCPRNENMIFKVKFSLDEINNRLDITEENKTKETSKQTKMSD